MFDVPVLVATASSAPVLMSGISQANQLAFYKPFVSSSFIKASAILSRQGINQPQILTEPAWSNFEQPKTLLPHRPFQLLEPLNLADTALVLDRTFVNSLDSIPSPIKLIDQASKFDLSTIAPEIDGIIAATPTAQDTEHTHAGSLDSSSIAAEQKSPTPVLPGHELRQCIDVPYEAPQEATALHVLIEGHVIGKINNTGNLEQVARTLREMLTNEQLNPDEIIPILGEAHPSIRVNKNVLLRVVYETRLSDVSPNNQVTLSNEWAAIAWSNQLRKTMGAAPLDAGSIQIMLKGLQPSEQRLDGLASWYGPYFHGRLTANGEIFDQDTLTAAHKSLPFNTVLQVRNLKNNRTVVVRINDRGPYIGKRSLDLSRAAAQCLGSEIAGVIPYEAVILE